MFSLSLLTKSRWSKSKSNDFLAYLGVAMLLALSRLKLSAFLRAYMFSVSFECRSVLLAIQLLPFLET